MRMKTSCECYVYQTSFCLLPLLCTHLIGGCQVHVDSSPPPKVSLSKAVSDQRWVGGGAGSENSGSEGGGPGGSQPQPTALPGFGQWIPGGGGGHHQEQHTGSHRQIHQREQPGAFLPLSFCFDSYPFSCRAGRESCAVTMEFLCRADSQACSSKNLWLWAPPLFFPLNKPI
jgi:hypothetical protein